VIALAEELDADGNRRAEEMGAAPIMLDPIPPPHLLPPGSWLD
jgi:hypothetical protein